ncbi:CHASE domain-containing protein [uncultured Brevundimonas sp.]|uniref:CHASE domain-containing protein n=1 Tax=uncultured Brevundimonas sp. TaxID=213418 RepID=UPI0030EC26F1|tara:strand:- start:14519 stop:19240 length:4722 start_codon:yes stop_codon:yes gene_type:complete
MWTSRIKFDLISKTVILAVLYVLTGKLGLMLAVPPGYATIIWPASGIAIGMLLVHGSRLWAGVLIGSFLLNLYNSHGFTVEGGFDVVKTIAALGIAAGSTLQAVVGRWLVARHIALPLKLKRSRDLFNLFTLSGPIACLIAATVGVGTLMVMGIVAPAAAAGNWLTWWMGDVLGVLIFMPLALVAPGNPHPPRWRGRPLARLSGLTLLMLIVPLGLTFYAWKITSENAYERAQTEFTALAAENEEALRFRMASYDYALLGAAAFYQGNVFFSRADWRSYVETIDIRKQFPGINGIGVIVPVRPENRDAFLAGIRADGLPQFDIHPAAPGRPLNVITHIEPVEINGPAVGLNTGFEDNRLEAANISRATASTAITNKIILVQDHEQTPGFLMMRPVYKAGLPLATAAQRDQNLKAWIYAPFIARNLLTDLTRSQGETLHFMLYDGESGAAKDLIFDSASSRQAAGVPAFRVEKTFAIMHQTWHGVWTSTPAFEKVHRSDQPLMVLVGGLLFTGLFGMFVILGSVRTTATMEWLLKDQKYAAPLLLFALVAGGTIYLFDAAKQREHVFIQDVVQEEAEKAALLITSNTRDRLLALKRMGQRWETVGGTPEDEWRDDAHNFIEQSPGLRAVQWVDASYHVRWIQPLSGNESAVGLDILAASDQVDALNRAASRNVFTISAPTDLVQGYRGIIAYSPIRKNGRFAGFLGGVFSSNQFFDGVLRPEVVENFAVTVAEGDHVFFSSMPEHGTLQDDLKTVRNIRVADTTWHLTVTPTDAVIDGHSSSLPTLLLIAGLMIAALLALTMRSILLSKVKSAYLLESNQLNTAILSSSALLIIATDRDGTVMLFNKAAETELGYDAAEVVGKMNPSVWHDPQEVVARAAELSQEMGTPFEPGFEVFVTRAERDGVESRQWTYIRKDGSRFPVNLTVTPLRDLAGDVTGYLGVAENVTERLEQQRALAASEEIFRTSMEHAPIGMGLASATGNWINVSPSLCELFGYSADELLGCDIRTLTHEDDLVETIDLRARALAGEIRNYQTEKRYYHRSGRIIWTLVNASLVRDHDGEPKFFIVQVQDITDRKEMDRIKSEFISVVSHELRTPLTSIRGSLGLVVGAMASELPAKATRLLEIAHNNCERLILLINDILDIDKLASGQMRFDVRSHDLAWLINQAVEANTAYAENFNVSLSAEPVEQNLQIQADADRLIQVLSNLLSNAAKFSPDGDSVVISTARAGSRVRISVTDHGPGIAEEYREQIFGKFSQGDSSITRARGGTGLGLHISRQIIEQMGGEIGFDTRTNHGSTFWFEVPVSQPHVAEAVIRTPDPAAGPAVLVCAGDDDSRVTLDRALSGAGYQVDVAITPVDVLQKVMMRDYAALVIDQVVSAENGLDLVRDLRALPAGVHLPVVLLSGVDGRDEVGSPEAGIAGIIRHAADGEEVRQVLSQAIAGAERLPRVLHVEDDEDFSQFLAAALQGKAELVTATTLSQAVRLVADQSFALVILDIGLPDGDGLSLLPALRDRAGGAIPVTILSAAEAPADVLPDVAAAMVKSRHSEALIVETILGLVENRTRNAREISYV